MSDLINRADLIEHLNACLAEGDGHTPIVDSVLTAVKCAVEQMPAADAEPIVHAHWIDKATGSYGRMQSWCSRCGVHSGIGGIISNRHKPRCPNCGAMMDEEGYSD